MHLRLVFPKALCGKDLRRQHMHPPIAARGARRCGEKVVLKHRKNVVRNRCAQHKKEMSEASRRGRAARKKLELAARHPRFDIKNKKFSKIFSCSQSCPRAVPKRMARSMFFRCCRAARSRAFMQCRARRYNDFTRVFPNDYARARFSFIARCCARIASAKTFRHAARAVVRARRATTTRSPTMKNFQNFLRKGLDEKKRIIKIGRHTVAIAMRIVMSSGAISTR